MLRFLSHRENIRFSFDNIIHKNTTRYSPLFPNQCLSVSV